MRQKISFHSLTPWTVLIRSALVCAFLACIVFVLSLNRIEPLPIVQEPVLFRGDLAHSKMRHLSKKFPNRVTWSPARVRAGEWLKSEFQKLGYTPKTLRFSEVIAGKQYTNLENIYVEKKGRKRPDEIIMAVAHYDITDTTTEGAMDDASGVGVVLELARIFSQEQTDRTMVFLLTDSEEFGAFWGARAFAQSYENAEKIVAALNFDFISPGKQTGILTLCDGLKSGFTPLWFREIALNSIRSIPNLKAIDLVGIEEFVIRSMQIPPADHGAFLAAGIPSLNWVGQPDNFPYVMAHYHHTQNDVAEALEVSAFQDYGASAEKTLRSVDALPRIPADFRDSSYWKVSRRYYMSGTSALILHILAFIPFLAYAMTKFGRTLRSVSKDRILEVIRGESKVTAILLGSMLLGYSVILLLPALHVITQYESFPATQKSLLLYTPNFIVILLVFLAIIGAYMLFRKIFTAPEDTEGYSEVRHALHGATITLIILLAFLKNSYLAVLLLLPPAYFWTGLSHSKKAPGRLLNGLLLLGGSITFVALAVLLSTVFHVGVFYWYLFLSAAYGLISAYSVFLFFMALTVMIRLFRSFVL